MKEVNFKKGDIIFREGDDGSTFYRIKSGKVGIIASYGDAGEESLATLEKDQYFGEMAVIETYPRSASAVALEDVDVTELTADDINDYFHSEPDKIIEIMKHICSRIGALTDDFARASATLKEMKGTEESARSKSLLDRIKKYASVYKRNKKYADAESVEASKAAEGKAHSEGFTGEVNSYSQGTVIFREGEKGDCMYDVHGGEVGIYKAYGTPDEKLLTKLMANEFFGEMGMLGNVTRSATAVVIKDNTIIESIYPSGLEELFKENPFKVDMILKHTSFRLRQLTRDYVSVCRQISEV